MTWVRLDDSVMSHPKMLGLDAVSFAVWVGGLAYANRHATDGHLPEAALLGLIPGAWKVAPKTLTASVAALLGSGLWSEAERGWSINGYAKYQEEALKANVETRRAAANDRKRAQREREKQREKPICHAVTGRDSHAVTSRDTGVTPTRDTGVTSTRDVGDAYPPLSQGPVPSRPVPSRPQERESARAPLKSVGQDLVERTQATRALLEEGFKSRGLVVPPCLHDQVPYSKEARAIAESVPLAQLPALIENFFASSWAAKRHFRVSLIVDNPNEYLGKTVKRTNTLPNEGYRDIGPEEAAKMLNDVLEGANA